MYEAGILALMGWWYHGWKGDPNARVDLIFPCFFPLGVAVLVNAYEIVSFSCLDRRRPINVIAVCFDVLICAGSTFCFLLLGLIDNDPVQDRLRTDSTQERWRRDQSKAMIFMIVFCFLHALFIIMASVGCVYSGILKNRARRRRRIARNRAQMARFANERRRQMDVDKAQVGAPVEDVGQSEERSDERNSRGTESTQSTELEGNERNTRERFSTRHHGDQARRRRYAGYPSAPLSTTVLACALVTQKYARERRGTSRYVLSESGPSYRARFSSGRFVGPNGFNIKPGGWTVIHQPSTHRLPCMVIATNNQDALPSQKALRKERKISGEAGDNKKRKKHNGETAEEKAERKKQKKSELGCWRYSDRGNRSLDDANLCTSPAGPAPDPNETEEQRKRRLRKEEEKKKEKKGEEGETTKFARTERGAKETTECV
ncbi:uncharacterized protein B0T23DRAFT_438299 [Neurospora hispaniola]|uniref:Transmembrane protein n=1 Tax=Neurospora hispaniola TaxID=588809 RepID=A0AAJ0MTW3_9PEZI|nr:hypothetical protein B0T23DRAFT_438299 [Neurospora hispaniola]